jgi:hypothetical protein
MFLCPQQIESLSLKCCWHQNWHCKIQAILVIVNVLSLVELEQKLLPNIEQKLLPKIKVNFAKSKDIILADWRHIECKEICTLKGFCIIFQRKYSKKLLNLATYQTILLLRKFSDCCSLLENTDWNGTGGFGLVFVSLILAGGSGHPDKTVGDRGWPYRATQPNLLHPQIYLIITLLSKA